MNEIAKSANITIGGKERARQIYGVCALISPQFYKNKAVDEMTAEIKAIDMLIAHIDDNVLSAMCGMAVENYARQRAEKSAVHFDINYILTFYITAFNKVNDGVPSGVYVLESFEKNEITGICTATYSAPTDEPKTLFTRRYISEYKNSKKAVQ